MRFRSRLAGLTSSRLVGIVGIVSIGVEIGSYCWPGKTACWEMDCACVSGGGGVPDMVLGIPSKEYIEVLIKVDSTDSAPST